MTWSGRASSSCERKSARPATGKRQALLMNRGMKGRSALVRMLAMWLTAHMCLGPAFLALASSGQEDSPKEQAAALAKKAKKAAKASKDAEAYILYSEASAMQPRNMKLKEKMESLQSR